MKITITGNTTSYGLVGDTYYIRHLLRGHKLIRWNPKTKSWNTRSMSLARLFSKFLDLAHKTHRAIQAFSVKVTDGSGCVYFQLIETKTKLLVTSINGDKKWLMKLQCTTKKLSKSYSFYELEDMVFENDI